jgi:UDP-glucose 4-epimerase
MSRAFETCAKPPMPGLWARRAPPRRVRDYVDVRDLADAHVRAAEALEEGLWTSTYNVGRGEGSSVLDVLDHVRAVTGRSLRHEVIDRRPRDPARIVGRVDRIAADLGWRTRHDLADMVRSAWEAETGTRVLR